MINDLGDFFPYGKKKKFKFEITLLSEIVSGIKNATIPSGIKYV